MLSEYRQKNVLRFYRDGAACVSGRIFNNPQLICSESNYAVNVDNSIKS